VLFSVRPALVLSAVVAVHINHLFSEFYMLLCRRIWIQFARPRGGGWMLRWGALSTFLAASFHMQMWSLGTSNNSSHRNITR
jgi:hypothetical protein